MSKLNFVLTIVTAVVGSASITIMIIFKLSEMVILLVALVLCYFALLIQEKL